MKNAENFFLFSSARHADLFRPCCSLPRRWLKMMKTPAAGQFQYVIAFGRPNFKLQIIKSEKIWQAFHHQTFHTFRKLSGAPNFPFHWGSFGRANVSLPLLLGSRAILLIDGSESDSNTLQKQKHIPPWEKETLLQNWLGGGYTPED